jgi:hypothetical protein
MSLSKMVLLSARIGPLLRWPGRCSLSIGLLGDIGPKRSTHVSCFKSHFPSSFHEENFL